MWQHWIEWSVMHSEDRSTVRRIFEVCVVLMPSGCAVCDLLILCVGLHELWGAECVCAHVFKVH